MPAGTCGSRQFMRVFIIAVPYDVVMKLSPFALLLLAPLWAACQTKTPVRPVFDHRSVVSLYPLRGFANTLMLGLEKKVSSAASFKVIAGVTQFREATLLSDAFNFTGVRLEAQYKYFPGKKPVVFRGAYVAPFVLIKTASFNYEYTQSQLTYLVQDAAVKTVAGGLLAGYQHTVGDFLTIDAYLGQGLFRSYGRNKMDVTYANRPFDSYPNAIGFYAGFCVGVGIK